MATTWTCADSHTHDVSKLGWKHPQGVSAGYDIECRTCGDRAAALNVGSNTATPLTAATIGQRWRAATRDYLTL